MDWRERLVSPHSGLSLVETMRDVPRLTSLLFFTTASQTMGSPPSSSSSLTGFPFPNGSPTGSEYPGPTDGPPHNWPGYGHHSNQQQKSNTLSTATKTETKTIENTGGPSTTSLSDTGSALQPSGISHGVLAAAVVTPVLFLLVLGALAFLCLRNRRRKNNLLPPPTEVRQMVADPLQPPSQQPQQMAQRPPNLPPIITSEQNNAYFTGLDTSSMGSRRPSHDEADYAPARRSLGGTFVEPPPPYKEVMSVKSPTSGQSIRSEEGAALPYTIYEEQAGASALDLAAPAPLMTNGPFGDSNEDVTVADGMMYNQPSPAASDSASRVLGPFRDPESPVSSMSGSTASSPRSEVSDLERGR